MSEQEKPAAESPAAEHSEKAEQRFETICGALLAIFAAVLAFSDLGGGNANEDRGLADNAQASQYSWYQSKSIKESLAENQLNMLSSLNEAGSFTTQVQPQISQQISELETDVERYGKEKKEILLGSATVGQENWAQDVNGEMGKVIGAEEYKAKVASLNEVDARYDSAGLFLQLCLVIGALSLLFKVTPVRYAFLGMCLILGAIGSWYTVLGQIAYSAVP
ncbi:DUF4337 family protein [bacterium]|nr:DUF4337 family protein [bacterium]